MFQFLHAADLHLDSPLRGLEQYDGAPVDEIRGATRRALENLVELAIDRRVDFVLIAGDVYDGDWKDHNTGLFFISQMNRLQEAGIPVVMISGNHDAANKMTKSLRLPRNVELLAHTGPRQAESSKLRDLGVAVHGQSFAQPAELKNLAQAYPQRVAGMFNIGLLHTSLTGAEGHEPYAPCSLDDLHQKQYGYWALGHVHNRGLLSDELPIVFPGNIQGRHIRETGAKGCYLVTVEDHVEPQLEFQPLDVLRWNHLELNAAGAVHLEDVLNPFSSQLMALSQNQSGLPLAVRVSVMAPAGVHQEFLSHATHWTNEIRAAAIEATNGLAWVEKVKFHSQAETISEEASGAMDGPMGELLKYLEELSANEAQLLELAGELTDLSGKLPGELLRGEDAFLMNDPLKMRELLSDIQSLLISRLTKGPAA